MPLQRINLDLNRVVPLRKLQTLRPIFEYDGRYTLKADEELGGQNVDAAVIVTSEPDTSLQINLRLRQLLSVAPERLQPFLVNVPPPAPEEVRFVGRLMEASDSFTSLCGESTSAVVTETEYVRPLFMDIAVAGRSLDCDWTVVEAGGATYRAQVARALEVRRYASTPEEAFVFLQRMTKDAMQGKGIFQ